MWWGVWVGSAAQWGNQRSCDRLNTAHKFIDRAAQKFKHPPIDDLPPNASHLQQLEFGILVPQDKNELHSSDLDFAISLFEKIPTKNIQMKCNSPTFGLQSQTDEIDDQMFICHATPSSSTGQSLNFGQPPKKCKRGLCGSCMTSANGDPVFDKALIINTLRKL